MINRTPRVELLLLGLLGAALVVVVGCSSSMPSPSAQASNLAFPSPIAVVDAAGFATATCTANQKLNLAFGNPDANVKSAAWKAFDSAVVAKDTAQIDATAGEVLLHLEAARVANARGATWAPGTTANAEMGSSSLACRSTSSRSNRLEASRALRPRPPRTWARSGPTSKPTIRCSCR